MPKSNLKTQSKRLREFNKQDKRRAKDEKRALRKAENRAQAVGDTAPVVPEVKVASVAPKPQSPRVHTQRIISTGIPVRKARA